MDQIRVRAPGRVNLIGDHTDYTGGLALPMAIDLETTIEATAGGRRLVLRSTTEPEVVDIALGGEPAEVTPAWGRYVAAVAQVVGATRGLRGVVTTTLPVGAGLSSSAALEVAAALALGFEGGPIELARACQTAEQLASGVPCGIMDQLASAAGVAGHALLLDCRSLDVTPVRVPDGLDIVVVHSGEPRRLEVTAYASRRAECEAAVAEIGSLRDATVDALAALHDPVLRRRARHVITENERVRETAGAMRRGDLRAVGELFAASHASLRDDFEVSTAGLDALVDELVATPGVLGARLTGAGFGGCVVAVAERGARTPGWRVVASHGASIERA